MISTEPLVYLSSEPKTVSIAALLMVFTVLLL
jgi:hypothetical protein